MKILIHALGADMGGAMRHLTNFLPELGRAASRFEFVVLVRSSVPDIEVSKNVQLERVPVQEAAGWLNRVAGDVVELPRRLKREGFSAVVSMLNTGPIWSPVPHIFFQRNSLYYCAYHLRLAQGRYKLELLLRRRLAVASMTRADIVVTPSRAMADMIRECCPETRPLRFEVLRHGYDCGTMEDPLEDRFVRRLGEANGTRLLYPSHWGRHKGFEILFEALAILKSRGKRATLFTTLEHADYPEGMRHFDDYIDRLGVRERVVFLGRVPQTQMGQVYRACDLVVYPSLCESFGFPMIEAMAHALPVVAAGTSVNREMCGDGALYYDPLSASKAADCIESALHAETTICLRAGAKSRVEDFDWSWARYAREFVGLIEDVT